MELSWYVVVTGRLGLGLRQNEARSQLETFGEEDQLELDAGIQAFELQDTATRILLKRTKSLHAMVNIYV